MTVTLNRFKLHSILALAARQLILYENISTEMHLMLCTARHESFRRKLQVACTFSFIMRSLRDKLRSNAI